MFTVSDVDADAIRTAFKEDGELSAAIELRRRFPLVSDNVQARACVRVIAGWRPLPGIRATVTQSYPARKRSSVWSGERRWRNPKEAKTYY